MLKLSCWNLLYETLPFCFSPAEIVIKCMSLKDHKETIIYTNTEFRHSTFTVFYAFISFVKTVVLSKLKHLFYILLIICQGYYVRQITTKLQVYKRSIEKVWFLTFSQYIC